MAHSCVTQARGDQRRKYPIVNRDLNRDLRADRRFAIQ